jgi:hypothetical protein
MIEIDRHDPVSIAARSNQSKVPTLISSTNIITMLANKYNNLILRLSVRVERTTKLVKLNAQSASGKL